MSLFSASGGVLYHWRAERYASSLWAPFRGALAAWLREHLPHGEELILVGPSGGHCLPLAELARFGRVSALEPDPVARLLLRRRLAPAQVRLEHRDLLLSPLLSGRSGLDALLEARPRAALLFCNVLGQLHFELRDDEQARFETEFRRRIVPLLAGRPWASFHDRWSLERAPHEPSPRVLDFDRSPSDDELGAAWFGKMGARVTVLDHGTTTLFPAALPRRYFAWQITPSALHVVEGVSGA